MRKRAAKPADRTHHHLWTSPHEWHADSRWANKEYTGSSRRHPRILLPSAALLTVVLLLAAGAFLTVLHNERTTHLADQQAAESKALQQSLAALSPGTSQSAASRTSTGSGSAQTATVSADPRPHPNPLQVLRNAASSASVSIWSSSANFTTPAPTLPASSSAPQSSQAASTQPFTEYPSTSQSTPSAGQTSRPKPINAAPSSGCAANTCSAFASGVARSGGPQR